MTHVLTRLIDRLTGYTRVTVMDLHPSGGGPPQVVFETDAASDQVGKPNDVALAPGGGFADELVGLAVKEIEGVVLSAGNQDDGYFRGGPRGP